MKLVGNLLFQTVLMLFIGWSAASSEALNEETPTPPSKTNSLKLNCSNKNTYLKIRELQDSTSPTRLAEIFFNFKDLNRILNLPAVEMLANQKSLELTQSQETAQVTILISDEINPAIQEESIPEETKGPTAQINVAVDGQLIRKKDFLNCSIEDSK